MSALGQINMFFGAKQAFDKPVEFLPANQREMLDTFLVA
jgi:hypothetical protein